MSKTRLANLCAIQYQITEIDNQVIFEERSGFYGCRSSFTLEWRSCGWFLIAVEASFDTAYLPHIVAASRWLDANYEITYDNGKGTARLREPGEVMPRPDLATRLAGAVAAAYPNISNSVEFATRDDLETVLRKAIVAT